MVKYPIIMNNCILCGLSVEITLGKGLCHKCYYHTYPDLDEGDKSKIHEKWLKYKANDIRGRQKRRRVLKQILGEKGFPHDIFGNVLCYVGLEGMIEDRDGGVNPLVDEVDVEVNPVDGVVNPVDSKKIE